MSFDLNLMALPIVVSASCPPDNAYVLDMATIRELSDVGELTLDATHGIVCHTEEAGERLRAAVGRVDFHGAA